MFMFLLSRKTIFIFKAKTESRKFEVVNQTSFTQTHSRALSRSDAAERWKN